MKSIEGTQLVLLSVTTGKQSYGHKQGEKIGENRYAGQVALEECKPAETLVHVVFDCPRGSS